MKQVQTAQRCVEIFAHHLANHSASVARRERSIQDGFQRHPRQCFKHYQQYKE